MASDWSDGGGEVGIALTRYLSDEMAPMLFADAADEMFDAAPAVAVSAIHSWITAQYHSPHPLPVSDYVFHAAKKLHQLGEFELVPVDRLTTYLDNLLPQLIELCPEQDRPNLVQNLEALGSSQTVVAAPVEIVHRAADLQSRAPDGTAGPQRGGASPPAETEPPPPAPRTDPPPATPAPTAPPPPADTGVRLNLLLDRFDNLRTVPAAASPAAGASEAVLAEILGEVAAAARSDKELATQLQVLESVGMPSTGEDAVRLLSRRVPNWSLPVPPPTSARLNVSGPLRAMRRVVGLARDGSEAMKRFSELVNVAVEEFNNGSLGRAVTLIDLAERMIADGEVDANVVKTVLGQTCPLVDDARLREEADQEQNHVLLRRVLAFFPPLSIEELLLELEVESKRDRRRFLVALLTVYGGAARAAALATLREAMAGDRPLSWFVERNLVHLLRKISRASEAPTEEEIKTLVHTSTLTGPLPLVREALAALGTTHHERAEKVLTDRVAEIEQGLLGKTELPHDAEELRSLLDSVLRTLARSRSKAARRCVVEHGLKRYPPLGNTSARLAQLSGQDLAEDTALVNLVVEALRSELPVKVFGVPVKTVRKAESIEHLIEALSGTDAPQVRQILGEIVDQYPGQSFSDTADAVLGRLGEAAEAAPEDESATASLSGDLDLFGLPNLLQNLADSRLSGVLTLYEPGGLPTARLVLVSGLLADATAGKLGGETAVYQLLERPAPGRFVFTRDDAPDTMPGATPQPCTPVLLEGMRRYDELVRAEALVPAEACLRPTDRKPKACSGESDANLMRAVWARAAQGATPAECEAEIAVDSFRVRRLFEAWFTQGALAPISE